MSFWKKLKRGFKKAGRFIKHTAGKIGRGLRDGVGFVRKTINKIGRLPVLGDALRKLGKTRILGLPSISEIGDSVLKGAEDVGSLASKLETDIASAEQGNSEALKNSLKAGIMAARSRLKK